MTQGDSVRTRGTAIVTDVRMNDGQHIIVAVVEGVDRKRIASVDFQGTAKREAWAKEDPEGRANAERLALCWNSHDDLVAALRHAREFVQMNVDELLASCCVTGEDGKPDRSTIDHMDQVAIDDAEGCLAKIDAALAKAGAP